MRTATLNDTTGRNWIKLYNLTNSSYAVNSRGEVFDLQPGEYEQRIATLKAAGWREE